MLFYKLMFRRVQECKGVFNALGALDQDDYGDGESADVFPQEEEEEDEQRLRVSQERQKTLDRLRSFKQVRQHHNLRSVSVSESAAVHGVSDHCYCY